jgi:hypothetical protein
MLEVQANCERLIVAGLSAPLDDHDDLVVVSAVDRLSHAEHRLAEHLSGGGLKNATAQRDR